MFQNYSTSPSLELERVLQAQPRVPVSKQRPREAASHPRQGPCCKHRWCLASSIPPEDSQEKGCFQGRRQPREKSCSQGHALAPVGSPASSCGWHKNCLTKWMLFSFGFLLVVWLYWWPCSIWKGYQGKRLISWVGVGLGIFWFGFWFFHCPNSVKKIKIEGNYWIENTAWGERSLWTSLIWLLTINLTHHSKKEVFKGMEESCGEQSWAGTPWKSRLRIYLTIISKVTFIKTAKMLLYLMSFEDTVFFSYILKFCT